MSITINTSSMTSMLSRSLYTKTTSINSIMQRLSTGISINSASDNAAYLSLSKKIDSRSSGFSTANNNIQTGISRIQTYEGYLGGIAGSLQRIRDLAVQASNGVYSAAERSMINSEAQQLKADIGQVSNQANQEIGGTATSSEEGFTTPVTQLTSAEATAQGYTMITDIAGLQAINSGLGGKYILMNDIDLSSLGTLSQSLIAQGTSFTGEFNGNGYSISNLNINSTIDYTGLFSRTNGATLKNVALISSNVTSTVGYVGGLVGQAGNSTITNSYATGNVSGSDVVGGLVGHAEGSSNISNSYATGSISGGGSYVGGLAGWVDNSTITNSYATGSVSGYASVGGLVGWARSGTVSNSYATGNVSGSNYYVGGLVGLAHGSSITSSASSGLVTGSTWVGGLAGRVISSTIDNTNFWNTTTSGQATSAGSAVGMADAAYQTAFAAAGYTSATSSGSEDFGVDLILQIGVKGDSESAYQIKNIGISLSSYLDISLDSPSGALDAITKMDDAINLVSQKRSDVGVHINILSSINNKNSIQNENLIGASSLLKDTDIAYEYAKLLRQQISQNMTISILQQSKALHADSVLQLISG